MSNTTVGVDLAKEVIQVCIYTNNKVHQPSAALFYFSDFRRFKDIWCNIAVF